MGMSPEQWELAKDLYEAALECDSAQRADFLQRTTADEFVREEVRRLLVEHHHVGTFLSIPLFADSLLAAEQKQKRFAPGEVLAERFRIVGFIAAGGMGEVYEAEDLTLKEALAIKTIRPEVLKQNNALARFKREVHLARKVTHPNVCRVFDLFWHKTTEGKEERVIVFVSMELLKGETLLQRIRQTGRLTCEEARPLVVQIASGLEAAHRAGVVHRDLKPGNVILVPTEEKNQIRSVITDFGLALRARADATTSVDLTGKQGAFFGTPAYMAPEQIEGKEVTKLADIYSLGLIIYEMVTGQHAFPADSPLASAAKRLSDPIVSPKRIVPELSEAWEKAITRCLQRDPNARYSSASDVAKAFADQEPDSSKAGRSRVYPRYTPLARFAFAFALLLVIAAALYHFRGWFGERHPTAVYAARRPTVAVLGFQNLSGKPDVAWISPTLSQMLGTELAAGEQLRIIPGEQVALGKIDLALKDDNSLGPDTLKRVRNNMGSDFVVDGSFLALEGQVRVDLALQDAVTGETIANISEAGPEQNLPELVTRAGERLRHKLGVADPSTADTAGVTASQSMSLKATRLYSEGLQQLHSFDSVAARDLFEQAVAEDPNYALAHSALAEAWRSLGYANKSAREAKKAMDLSAGLSRENRLAIEAQYRNSTREIARETEIYKTLFNFYPDNLEYGLSLAKSEYFSSQLQEANSTLDALQQLPSPAGDDLRIDFVRSAVAIRTGDSKKALALAERVQLRAQQIGAKRLAAQALQNQCELLSKLGEPAKASAACDKSRLIFADIGDLAGEAAVWGLIAFQAEDAKSGRIANEKQITLLKKVQSDGGLAWAMSVAGELSADLGDYTRALREYTEALKLYQKVGDQYGVGSAYGNLGWVNSLQGSLTEAVKNDEEAIALTRQTSSKGEMDLWLVDLAEVLLEQGDVHGATKRLDEGFQINNDTDDKRAASYLHTTRLKLLLAEGDLDESRREARLATDPLILARLDIAQNHSQTAVDALRNVLANAKTKQEDDNQIEARALLIEALLTMPSDESKREVALLARVAPNTPNVGLRLTANLQIARARLALGDKVGASELLTQVISESQLLGYESQWLEARLTQAEMEIQSGELLAGRRQIDQIAKEAEAKGLMLIANEARRNL